MRPPSGSGRVIALVLSLGLAGCATLPLDRSWVEVRSEHFTVISDAAPERAEELARTLELFRAAVVQLTSVREPEAAVPTRIVYFGSRASHAPFRHRRWAGGSFTSTPTANFLTLRDGDAAQDVARHEYTHHLVHGRTGRLYPVWYDEGFAQYLSTLEKRQDALVLGRPPAGLVEWLAATDWLSMAQVLRFDWSQDLPTRDVGRLYAQSWLLVHYLHRDAENAGRFGDRFVDYAQRVEAGEDPAEAFEAAFEENVDSLADPLRRYLRVMRIFTTPSKGLVWSDATQRAVLERGEVAARLGELALARGDAETARQLYREALAEAPGDAGAQLGMARTLIQAGDLAGAEPWLARALEAAPEDPLVQLHAGRYWTARAEREASASARAATLARARRHLGRSWRLDDTVPATYLAYGVSFLLGGEDPQKAVPPLEKAMRLLPSSVDVGLALARAYGAVGRYDDARQVLARIGAWHRGDGVAEQVQSLLAWIEQRSQ